MSYHRGEFCQGDFTAEIAEAAEILCFLSDLCGLGGEPERDYSTFPHCKTRRASFNVAL